MKIALLADGLFPFVVGGIQKHTLYLAKYLARTGILVDLYYAVPSSAPDPAESKLFTIEEEQFVRLVRVNRPVKHNFPGHYIRESYEISAAIWEKFKERRDVDFVFAQGFAGWYTLNQKSQVKNLPPIGVHFHGLEMWQKPATFKERLNQWMFRPFVKKNIRKADLFLSFGDSINKIVPLRMTNVATSYNGISNDWLYERSKASQNSKRRFLFIGRYERRKGIEELHAILEDLDKNHDFQIDMIGPVPEQLRLKSPKIKYWGLLKSENQIRKIMQRMDVLVCPSYSEGMPTVILEAMASGLAILATDVGAVAEMVSMENGWLIQPGNERALRDAMIQVLSESPDDLKMKQLASIERVKKDYLWETVVGHTVEQIEKVLK